MLAVHLKYNFKGIFHQSHHQGVILKKEREKRCARQKYTNGGGDWTWPKIDTRIIDNEPKKSFE